ncbi:DsrE family protein [Sulfurimonas sediminis]|uniref:DsrE family protein n=1 Tax=Sulfurimonas sediminis TaxID=2590020 RepID=A0A7M1B3S3_9BACT|nr:DsrE family protein [Sulfurimonas sediminis]QOP44387.1 DsrE family protein [Sulfurimonas sediminis]
MKKILLIVSLLFSLVQAEDESAKVVYDLTTKNLAKFERNILKGIVFNKTLYANQLKELDVAVVIHGGAYRFFVQDLDSTIFKNDDKLQKMYKELKKRIASMADTYDVEFLMCGAAMQRNKLTKKDIVPFVTIIPNSTIGLINKQNEGYAYIPVGD